MKKPTKRYYIICYDIEETKKRTKLAKWLLNYGVRVQKSVFEAYLDEETLGDMIEGAKQYIASVDSLRVYSISKTAYERKLTLGTEFEYVPTTNVII